MNWPNIKTSSAIALKAKNTRLSSSVSQPIKVVVVVIVVIFVVIVVDVIFVVVNV